jgi:putative ABC transport system ATP-binding protein
VLTIRQLSRSFREGTRVHRVLDNADATVARGEIVAIMGRSGAGKSTLLNLVSGIDQPDSGTVQVGEQVVSGMREPERTLFRRARVGFVYQFFNLIPTLNVAENVRLVLELNGVRAAQARHRTLEVLAGVGLAARAASSVDQLSGGEQQRVAIARALVHRPALLLADEPTGNLDDESAREVLALLLATARDSAATLVMVTHDLTLARAADRALELRDGRLHQLTLPTAP